MGKACEPYHFTLFLLFGISVSNNVSKCVLLCIAYDAFNRCMFLCFCEHGWKRDNFI